MKTKIAWLDSCRKVSHIHIVEDDSQVTLCGHPVFTNSKTGRWIISRIPNRHKGRSSYCGRGCFVGIKKKREISWHPECSETKTAS